MMILSTFAFQTNPVKKPGWTRLLFTINYDPLLLTFKPSNVVVTVVCLSLFLSYFLSFFLSFFLSLRMGFFACFVVFLKFVLLFIFPHRLPELTVVFHYISLFFFLLLCFNALYLSLPLSFSLCYSFIHSPSLSQPLFSSYTPPSLSFCLVFFYF